MKSEIETPKKSRPKSGKGAMNGNETGVSFAKQPQPSGTAKSLGWKKKRLLKDLLSISTGSIFEGSQKNYRKITAAYFQIAEKDVTVLMIMQYRQVEKAILKGDTFAFNAIMDRAFGKATQPIGLDENLTGKVKITISGKRK